MLSFCGIKYIKCEAKLFKRKASSDATAKPRLQYILRKNIKTSTERFFINKRVTFEENLMPKEQRMKISNKKDQKDEGIVIL